MKLLIITQKVDRNDPILGFFHRWIEEFAKNFEKVTVIALGVGDYDLPRVNVLSLGKERGLSRLGYLWNFYKYIWSERKNYDAVFVHMNQEYVVLAGIFWRLIGKKVYLWRNHAKGSFFTNLAAILSHKIFCTSPRSYTARFKKTKVMPVGVDTDFFKPDPNIERIPKSILFLGRIAPVKKVLEFVDWVKDKDFEMITIAGGVLPKDLKYERHVRTRVSEHGLKDRIRFIGPVTQEDALRLYQTHEVYANFTPAGSMDKTIIEAVASGAKVIIKNPDLKDGFKVEDHSLKALMSKFKTELSENKQSGMIDERN